MSAEYEGAMEIKCGLDSVDGTLTRIADGIDQVNAKLIPLLEVLTEEILMERARSKTTKEPPK